MTFPQEKIGTVRDITFDKLQTRGCTAIPTAERVAVLEVEVMTVLGPKIAQERDKSQASPEHHL